VIQIVNIKLRLFWRQTVSSDLDARTPNHDIIASGSYRRHLGAILNARSCTMAKVVSRRSVQFAVAFLLSAAVVASPQQPQPGSGASAPDVGQTAPDFSLLGATRYGLLRDPVKLSDFRGQTVVLAFFPKARTKG
jgi:hypothetical protein